MLNWLKSNLYNRKQRVVMQFVISPYLLSDWEIVRHGVPQGSVLGPLLFSVYINDFSCIVNKVSHTILFADGANIIVSSSDHKELNSKVNSVVRSISEWFQNTSWYSNKTLIVKFTSSKFLTYPLHMAYNNRSLTINENIKLLGMHLNCHLSWKIHVDNLVKKLSSIVSCREHYYPLLLT